MSGGRFVLTGGILCRNEVDDHVCLEVHVVCGGVLCRNDVDDHVWRFVSTVEVFCVEMMWTTMSGGSR